MSQHFSHGFDIECPDCKVKGRRRNPLVECIERNYSGCGRDIGRCPECGHGFEVAYQIKAVKRDRAFDGLTRAQEDAEWKAAQDQNDRETYEKLKQRFEGT